MKVKIGGNWISSDDQDICVQFTDSELSYIKETMPHESAPNNRFCVMKERGRTIAEMRDWIRECD